MPLPQEILDLITAFRKETEDLVQSKVEEMFLIKHQDLALNPGNNNITFPGYSYDSGSDYVIDIYRAIDGNGIDVRGELEIPDASRTANGFIINALNSCSIRFVTKRKTPKINYWT